MTRRATLQLPAPPEALSPTYRGWGSRQPPTDRSEFWSFARDAAAAAAGSSSDTATPGSIATLRMYGPIDSWGGCWGISAGDVSAALDELGDVDEIRVRINSPGGEVWEGMAILNMLRAHKARIVAIVDGIAASAASFVAAGCDETVMSPGTQMMIHDASTFAYGDAATMQMAKDFLDSMSNSIASVYTEAAGGTDAEWRALMVATTWYTAAEAVSAGLAERVAVVPDVGVTSTATQPEETVEVVEVDPDAQNRFDLSMYRPHKPPTASAGGSTHTEGGPAVAFSDEQITTMRQTLGLPETADETAIVAAVNAVVEESLEERPSPDTTPTASAAADVQPGMVLVPQAAWDEAQHNARLGAGAAEQLRVQEREQFLDEHRDRFLPTNRQAYRDQYDVNREGTRAYLESAPIIVPLDLVGHEVDNSDADTQDDGWFPGYVGAGDTTTKEA